MSAEFKYLVSVDWNLVLDGGESWNEVCAQGIEMFGLPGDRYQTEASEQSLIWRFKDANDALLFRLKFSEVVC